MDNFKITKTILENINEQNDRINECVDIVNGYTTDEETRVSQELQRQENELRREEQYNNNENRFVDINEQLEDITKYTSGLVNVKELGAKGDGVSDDTEILKLAFSTYTDVYIPNGIYLISDTLIFENLKLFYSSDGYKGRTLTMDKSAIIKITTNKHCIIVRGSNMRISGGTLTYLNAGYSSDLLRLEGLDENNIKITCNNVIDNVYLVSQHNVSLIPNGQDFYGNGIHMVSNGTNAMYSNRFINCYIADLKYGLLIESGSSVGINGNSFDLSIWNCNCLCKTNGNGNVFSGNLQTGRPGSNSELSAIECNGSYNHFLWYIWDAGQFPYTNKYSYNFGDKKINNYVSQALFGENLKGNYKQNIINYAVMGDFTKEYNRYKSVIPFNMRSGSFFEETVTDKLSHSENSIANEMYVTNIVPTYTNLKSNLGGSIGSVYELDSSFLPTNLKPLTKFQNKILSFSKVTSGEVAKLEININISQESNSLFPRCVYICTPHSNNCLKDCNVSVSAIFGKSSLGTMSYNEEPFLKEAPRTFYRMFTITDSSRMQNAYNSNLQTIKIVIEIPSNINTTLALNYLFGSFADFNFGYVPSN